MTGEAVFDFPSTFVQHKQQVTFADALEPCHGIFQILNYQPILVLFNSNQLLSVYIATN